MVRYLKGKKGIKHKKRLVMDLAEDFDVDFPSFVMTILVSEGKTNDFISAHLCLVTCPNAIALEKLSEKIPMLLARPTTMAQKMYET